MKNYYRILGIPKDATKDEITRAYRKLAVKYHPDKTNDSTVHARFQEINEAKNVLLNEGKRIEYEDHLHNAYSMNDKGFKGSINSYTDHRSKIKKLLLAFLLIMVTGSAIILIITRFNNAKNNTAEFTATESENESLPVLSSNKKTIEKDNYVPVVDDKNLLDDPFPQISNNKDDINKPADIRTELSVASNTINIKTENNKPGKPLINTDNSIQIITLTENEMEDVLQKLNAEKSIINNYSNCIQVKKTKESNVENAFELATYLSDNGYVISGRQIISADTKGILIDAKEGCINLIIGIL